MEYKTSAHNNHNHKEHKIMAENYAFENKLGSGSFGDVYLTIDKKTNQKLAAKVEKNKTDDSRLYEEYKIYRRLMRKNVSGIPKIYNWIQTPKYNILVMELLGDNLENLFVARGKKFKLETVLLLGIDMVNLLKGMHNVGYIHRDIKPNNFMIGVEGEDRGVLRIMDFGLSKRYMINKKHISCKLDKSLTGTARYASINVHMGIEPSRRDDMESVGYMLLFFMLGKLPWQGLKKKSSIDHLEQIGDVKLCTNFDKLCADLPVCFKKYISYCRKLEFYSKPDYDYLINLFKDTAKEKKLELKYEWLRD